MIQVLKFYFSILLKRKGLYILYTILLLISTAIMTLLPLFYKFIIDAISGGQTNIIMWLVVGYLIAILLEALSWAVCLYVLSLVSYYAYNTLATSFFEKILQLDYAFHTEKSSGKLISSYKRGEGAFKNFLWNVNNNAFQQIIKIVISMLSVALIHPLIGGLLFLSIVIIPIISIPFLKENIRMRKEENTHDDNISGKIVDTLITFENSKLFGKEKQEKTHLSSLFKTYFKADRRLIWSYRKLDVSTAVGAFIVGIISFGTAFLLFSQGHISAGSLIFVLAMIFDAQNTMIRIVYDSRNIGQIIADMPPLMAVFASQPRIQESESAITPRIISGNISFQNIAFGYEKKTSVIRNFNLNIKAGEKVAFVGKSGNGKTTLIKLLLRLYDPTSGTITVDSHDIKTLSFAALRKNIGIVPQDPIMMNASIAENIGYPKTNCSQKEIVEAAKKANLHEFIMEQPLKYKTIVGERGIKLSGGQRQRMAIARAFIHNPQILIFDEATSQLDSENEQLIQDALWKISKNKTVIIIAHRLSTVMHVDKIVVLENGTIKEQGTHSDLLGKKSSLYAYLWGLQTKHKL